MFKVAVDGPSGAGKSTISKEIAKKLGFVYIDTGAMYRAAALCCLQNGVNIKEQPEKAVEIVEKAEIVLKNSESGTLVFLNGKNVTAKIRTPEISLLASAVSAIGGVRAVLVEKQREMGNITDVIMDGRDIGTNVLKDADVKIFLTASDEARAKRRFEELAEKGENVSFNDVLFDMRQRDKNDSEREISPLRAAEDSITVDTTELDFNASVSRIYEIITERLGS